MNIDTFIATLPDWQKQQCLLALKVIRDSSSEIVESLKWGNPYFDLHGSFIKFFVAKDWVNIYFYKGYLLQSELFEPSDNTKMRTVKLYANKPFDIAEFTDLVNEAAKLNKN